MGPGYCPSLWEQLLNGELEWRDYNMHTDCSVNRSRLKVLQGPPPCVLAEGSARMLCQTFFENVSLTRRVRTGACGSRRGPMPPSAVLLLPVLAAAEWQPHAGPPAPPPAPGFYRDRGIAGKELWVPERPWEPPPESDGGGSCVCRSEAGRSADSPGASGVSFSQVPINDNAPLSN